MSCPIDQSVTVRRKISGKKANRFESCDSKFCKDVPFSYSPSLKPLSEK